jgi:hypothetical protein
MVQAQCHTGSGGGSARAAARRAGAPHDARPEGRARRRGGCARARGAPDRAGAPQAARVSTAGWRRWRRGRVSRGVARSAAAAASCVANSGRVHRCCSEQRGCRCHGSAYAQMIVRVPQSCWSAQVRGSQRPGASSPTNHLRAHLVITRSRIATPALCNAWRQYPSLYTECKSLVQFLRASLWLRCVPSILPSGMPETRLNARPL